MSQFHFIDSNLEPGLSVIEASAGTGKTFAISHLVPRLLLEGTVRAIGDILLVTFTNDAAGELSDRVRRVLEKLAVDPADQEEKKEPGVYLLRQKFSSSKDKAILQQALVDIDQLTVSTIHSFCQRTLQTEGTLSGVPAPLELTTDWDGLIEAAVYEVWQEKIVADNDLATLAIKGEWKIENDVEFVKKALAMEAFEPVPPIKPQEILTASQAFDEAMMGELDAFFQKDIQWKGTGNPANREAPLLAIRAAHAKGYCDTVTGTNEGFWKALKWLSKLDDAIGARNPNAELLKAEIQKLRAVRVAHDLIKKREPFSSHAKDRVLWYWLNQCLDQVRGRIVSALKANRQITHDGLIQTLRDALQNPITGGVLAQRMRDRYKVALIDESQDTDPKQFEIFKRIFLGSTQHRLVLIGDPKQAIYGFRGADVNTYLTARNSAGNAVFTLTETYRSPAPLVNAVNAFFTRPQAFLKEELEFTPAVSKKNEAVILVENGLEYRSPLEAWIVPDDQHSLYQTSQDRLTIISETVASKIVALLKNGKKSKRDAAATHLRELGNAAHLEALLPSDFAVLTNTKRQAETIADALKRRGVPAVLATDADVLESDEAWELLCLLKAMQSPRRSALRYAALATRLIGYDARQISGLRSGTGRDNDPDLDESFIGKFTDWYQIWEKEGFAKVIDLMDREFNITKRLAASELGERRVTNFRQLTDLIQSAGHDHSNRPEHLLRWLSQEIKKAEQNEAPEERLLRLENDGHAVQILTMHKSKGLEFDFVFCPYLWDMGSNRDKFPKLPKSGAELTDQLLCKNLLKNDDPILLRLAQNQMEDRLRLAYVAMTRAKSRLWIYAGRMGGDDGRSELRPSPLDWLLRGPQSSQDETSLEKFDLTWNPESPMRGTRHERGIQALNTLIEQNQWATSIHPTVPPLVTEERWIQIPGTPHSELDVLPVPNIPGYWRVTSFSALTRETHRHGGPGRDIIPDVPISIPIYSPTLDAGNVVPTHVVPKLNAFAAAPGSPLIGTAIHDWLEQWDFGGLEKKGLTEAQLTVHLKKYPLLKQSASSESEPKKGVAVVGLVEMLTHLAGVQLPGLDCTIAEGCPSPQASEWNFHMAIQHGISPQKLAEAFEKSPDPRFPNYAEALAELTMSSVHGYLQGFMDRLVFHQGSYGVIDWKSNKLGNSVEAYSEASLIRCATENHYILQTHLYLVAMRRFLKLSGKSNAPLAGAWLVFLRAVQAGSSSGILHIHPTPERLDSLDHLFFERKS